VSSAVRPGFSLLEALIAMTIVGLAAIGTLEAFRGETEAARRARSTLVSHALADERLSVLQLASRSELLALPDSLASGTFAPPFAEYSWHAEAQAARNERDLVDVTVAITLGADTLRRVGRLYRPRRAEPSR
jgi:prepilin-type N-terminal cleavage/methylation domain-containing protein